MGEILSERGDFGMKIDVKFADINTEIPVKFDSVSVVGGTDPSEIDKAYNEGYAEGAKALNNYVHDGRTSLAWWYAYLGGVRRYADGWDEELEEDIFVEEPEYIDLEFPQGTKNVTDVRGMFACIYDDDGSLFESKYPVRHITGTFDASSVTDLSYFFEGLEKLETVGEIKNTSNVTHCTYVFSYCSKLTETPRFDTRNVQNFGSFAYSAPELVTVGELDLRSATFLSNMFQGCESLQYITLKNIKANLMIGSSWWGHKIEKYCLINTIRELRNAGASRTLTIGNPNLAKLADVYVKLIPITDEMRAADEFIDEKLPFEVCESTDEGAMLLTTEYVLLKNWQVK